MREIQIQRKRNKNNKSAHKSKDMIDFVIARRPEDRKRNNRWDMIFHKCRTTAPKTLPNEEKEIII